MRFAFCTFAKDSFFALCPAVRQTPRHDFARSDGVKIGDGEKQRQRRMFLLFSESGFDCAVFCSIHWGERSWLRSRSRFSPRETLKAPCLATFAEKRSNDCAYILSAFGAESCQYSLLLYRLLCALRSVKKERFLPFCRIGEWFYFYFTRKFQPDLRIENSVQNAKNAAIKAVFKNFQS